MVTPGFGILKSGTLLGVFGDRGVIDPTIPPVTDHAIWIDAKKVYSDTSGTTLCTDGQTIASFINRSTGAVTLPDSTLTARPTYKAGPCFLADDSPAIRIDKSSSQFIRFPSFSYNKRALTAVVVGSNNPGETYVGGSGVPTTTWSLGNSDYYQGTSGTIGEWLFPTALTANIYRLQFPYPNIHVLDASTRMQVQFHSEQSGSAVTAGTGTGLLIGARGSTPGTFGDLWIRHILVYTRALTEAELASLSNWALTELGHITSNPSVLIPLSSPHALTDNRIVISGNSICAGSGTTTPRTSCGGIIARRLKDYNYQVINCALGGQSGSTIDSYYADQAGRYFTEVTGTKIAIVWEIVNSVQYNEYGSAALYYANLGSIADKARAAGADYVIGVTAPVQNWGSESSLRLVNDALMADSSSKFDYVVDCRQDRMGYFNASLFADNYHPTDDGSAYLEEIIWQDGIRKIVDPETDPYTSRIFAHYDCSETSGNLIDISGNGNDLPAVGSPGTDGAGARTVNPTAYFQTNNYLWQPVNEDFSLFLRFYPTGDGFVFGIRGSGSTAHFSCGRRTGNFQWNIGSGESGASDEYYDSVAMSANAWHTWAISGNRRTHEIRMRLDGGTVDVRSSLYYWPWVSIITSPIFYFGGSASYLPMQSGSKISRLIYWKGYKISDQQMLDLHNGTYPG